jgi:transcriptional regulator with XRE-family HTH domain
VPRFDVSGALRRIRRLADLSQRELAEQLGVSKSAVAAAESGTRGLDLDVLTRAADLAGLRLALLDGTGEEVTPMDDDTVRDRAWRHFPAHLDTVYSEERWSYFEHRLDRPVPWYTFVRHRAGRDALRGATGPPDDHLLPQPGDSPAERRARRMQEARRRYGEELHRRREAGELAPPEEWTCTCPAPCDELDDFGGRPVHADDCTCRCDVA